MYSPWELEGASLDGSPFEIERQAERGRFVYSLFLDVSPEGAIRTVVLDLAGRVPAGERYRLDLAGQPLATPDDVEVSVTVADARAGEVTASQALRVAAATAPATGPLTDERSSYVVGRSVRRTRRGRPRTPGRAFAIVTAGAPRGVELLCTLRGFIAGLCRL